MKVSEIKSHLFTLLTIFLWRKKEGKKGRLLTLSFFFSMSFFPYTVCFALLFFFFLSFLPFSSISISLLSNNVAQKSSFTLFPLLALQKKKKNRKTECGVVCMLQNVHRFFCLVYLYTPYVEVERRFYFAFLFSWN